MKFKTEGQKNVALLAEGILGIVLLANGRFLLTGLDLIAMHYTSKAEVPSARQSK